MKIEYRFFDPVKKGTPSPLQKQKMNQDNCVIIGFGYFDQSLYYKVCELKEPLRYKWIHDDLVSPALKKEFNSQPNYILYESKSKEVQVKEEDLRSVTSVSSIKEMPKLKTEPKRGRMPPQKPILPTLSEFSSVSNIKNSYFPIKIVRYDSEAQKVYLIFPDSSAVQEMELTTVLSLYPKMLANFLANSL